MEPGQPGAANDRGRWCRCAFDYTIDGDLRYISHRDTLRMFRRALARTALPVRFTEGFNPHPRIMIPLPRPVGVASEAETIVVEFEEPIDHDEALDRLDRETPADLRMVSVRLLQPKEQLRPTQARYCLDVGHSRLADLDARIRRVIKADVLEVERPILKSKRTRTVDIRPYLLDIRVDGDAIEYTLRVTGTGTARPAEVAGLLGYDANAINHRIRRIEVRWQ